MKLAVSALLIFATLGLSLGACGPRGDMLYNDPTPNGTVVATAVFGGSSVSGSISIYDMEDGDYIIRLVDFKLNSASGESGIQMIPYVDGVVAAYYSLKGSSGNQNYPFSYDGIGTPTWTKIVIHSVQQNTDLGEAGF